MVEHRIVTEKRLIVKIWSPVFNSQFWDLFLLQHYNVFFFQNSMMASWTDKMDLQQKVKLEKKEKQLLDEITRDIVAIVATIISLIAFGFAIWATVATMKQASDALKAEQKVAERIEILEQRILAKLNTM